MSDMQRFRWVSLQLQDLKRLTSMSHKMVERTLYNLPKDLESTYLRILSQVDTVLAYEVSLALKWITFSARTLYIEELIDACIIAPIKQPCVNPTHRLDYVGLQDVLRGLITIEPPLDEDDRRCTEAHPRTHTVTLSHFSVQEFLSGETISKSHCHQFTIDKQPDGQLLAKACLTYLYDFNAAAVCNNDYHFLTYAWYHWDQHVEPSPDSLRSPIRRSARRMYRQFTTTKSLYARYLGLPDLRGDHQRFLNALGTPFFRLDFEIFREPTTKTQLKAQGEIRLLKLLPSLQQDNLKQCYLYHANLIDLPTYDALSYLWGEGGTGTIQLDGKRVTIRSNLADFLESWQYQSEDAAHDLWIDSLCIDQSNIEEREHQVMHMRRIFQQSRELIIWMGQLTPSINLGLELLQKVATWTQNAQTKNSSPRSQELLAIMQTSENDSPRTWDAIHSVVRNPWWTRAWTVQEACLPRTARLMFGRHSFLFSNLETVMLSIQMIQTHLDTDPVLGKRFRSLRDTHEWTTAEVRCLARAKYQRGHQFTLLELLAMISSQKTMVVHDRIYAFLGLLPAGSVQSLFRPNYSATFEDVCIETAYCIIGAYKTLDILAYRSSCGPTKRKLPSWVPDFSVGLTIPVLGTDSFGRQEHDSSAQDTNEPVGLEVDKPSGIPNLKGVVVEQITALSSVYVTCYDCLRSRDLLLTSSNVLLRKIELIGEDSVNIFLRTMTAGRIPESVLIDLKADDEVNLSESKRHARKVKAIEEHFQLVEHPDFLQQRRMGLCGETLILAPGTAAKGDIFVAVPGWPTPMVIRQLEKRSNKALRKRYPNTTGPYYEFIGERCVNAWKIFPRLLF